MIGPDLFRKVLWIRPKGSDSQASRSAIPRRSAETLD